MEEGTRRKYTLVFDEFQNFLEVNPSIYSDIQNWWDKYQKESHVNMVVCSLSDPKITVPSCRASIEDSIRTLKALAAQVGPEKIAWRYLFR